MPTGIWRRGVWRRGTASGNRNGKRQQQGSGNELDAFLEELQRRPEVRIINKYALLAAYVRIALKSIGALMLLWATVVLLGGFVDDLKKVDFWILTSIAFLQAIGLVLRQVLSCMRILYPFMLNSYSWC